MLAAGEYMHHWGTEWSSWLRRVGWLFAEQDSFGGIGRRDGLKCI
jgi:hypothetical protein